jgi:hypothetical protein
MREYVPYSGEAPRAHRRGTRQHGKIALKAALCFEEAFARATSVHGTTVTSRTHETQMGRANTGRRKTAMRPFRVAREGRIAAH